MATERLAASEALAKWGSDLSARNVRVLPMPLVFDRLPNPSPVPADGFVLGVGRLVPEKGFDVLIDALASFEADQRPELVVVGVGPDRHALAEQAAKAEVKLHLPGAVAPAELADWYRRARIVAVPSRREGFGLVAAEAAAAGRAVVGSAVGGIPVVVESGVSGLLVEPGDVDALSKALKEVDPEWGANGPVLVAHLDVKTHGRFVRQMCDNLTA
jgi:glycosyltransferase involved in cell wall biosynthesis